MSNSQAYYNHKNPFDIAYVKLNDKICSVSFKYAPVNKTRRQRCRLDEASIAHDEKSNIRRAQRTILEYALANPIAYFGTFTIDDELIQNVDYLETQELVFKTMRAYLRDNGVRAILIPEYGEKKGRFHVHAIIFESATLESLIRINEHGKPELAFMRDNFGFNNMTKVFDTSCESAFNVALYVSKYITKDNIKINGKRYTTTFHLKRYDKQEVARIIAVYDFYKALIDRYTEYLDKWHVNYTRFCLTIEGTIRDRKALKKLRRLIKAYTENYYSERVDKMLEEAHSPCYYETFGFDVNTYNPFEGLKVS